MAEEKVKKTKKRRAANEGTIVPLPNGKFRVQISLGYKEDGTRNRISEVCNTEKEAVAWKTKMLARAEVFGKDSVIDEKGMFNPRYHKWLLEVKKGDIYSRQFKTTMRHYHKWIKPYFERYKEKEITYERVQQFFKQLEETNVGLETRRKIRVDLRQYFEHVYKNTPMRNPVDGVKLETQKKVEMVDPIAVFHEAEYKAVPKDVREEFLHALDIDTHSPFLKPLCYLMYFTGNRVGEALAYQWKDFDFERRYFLVYKSLTVEYEFDEFGNTVGKGKTVVKMPKTKNGIRPLPLLDILCEVLLEWYDRRKALEKITGISFTAPDDFIFATDTGEIRTEGGTYSIFQRFLKRYDLHGKGIHFQALRQTFSNSLFANGAAEQIIQDIMGHASISTTKKHYKTLQKFDSVQEAAQQFNALYEPQDKKYKAGKNVTFAPEGYVSEEQAIQNIAPAVKEKAQEDKADADKLVELLGNLKTKDPELFKRLKEIVSE